MTGVLVQATEPSQNVKFTVAESKRGNSIAKATIVVSTDGKAIDNAIVRFDEGATLGKLQFRENSSKLYFPQNGEEFAIANAQEGEMPLYFKVEKNGTYTLSFNAENVEFSYLLLIDNITNNVVDLLKMPSYTFEAKTTDYDSRFKLVFSTQQSEEETNIAFISNGNIIVTGTGIVQAIDVMGRVLFNHEVSSIFHIPASDFSSSVYVLRLINGDKVKTQKIVVK